MDNKMINISDVSKQLYETINQHIDFETVPKGDFISHVDKVIGLEINNIIDIKNGAESIAIKLYDELDKNFNFPPYADDLVKNIFLPIALELLQMFFQNNISNNDESK